MQTYTYNPTDGLLLFLLLCICMILLLVALIKRKRINQAEATRRSQGVFNSATPPSRNVQSAYPTARESPLSATRSQSVGVISNHDLGQLVPARSISMEYHYKRRDLVMTPAETRFFKILVEVIGDNYYVFPQVHLSSILEHRINGQNWWAAFHHINRKSVDYVVCTKDSVRPVAAIELDDWSHRLEDRKARDIEVERIFRGANFPLIRFGEKTRFSSDTVRDAIAESGVIPLPLPVAAELEI